MSGYIMYPGLPIASIMTAKQAKSVLDSSSSPGPVPFRPELWHHAQS